MNRPVSTRIIAAGSEITCNSRLALDIVRKILAVRGVDAVDYLDREGKTVVHFAGDHFCPPEYMMAEKAPNLRAYVDQQREVA